MQKPVTHGSEHGLYGAVLALEIRRDILFPSVGILSQENQVRKELGVTERVHLQSSPVSFLLMVTTVSLGD